MLHVGVHAHLHAGIAHVGHAPLQGDGVIDVGRGQKFQVVHGGGAGLHTAVPARYHASDHVNPLHQDAAKERVASVHIRGHDDMHLLGAAGGYGLGGTG